METQNSNIPNFIFQLMSDQGPVAVTLGCGLLTGVPLVGDEIDHENGHIYVVTRRTWISGEKRIANMLIHLEEKPT